MCPCHNSALCFDSLDRLGFCWQTSWLRCSNGTSELLGLNSKREGHVLNKARGVVLELVEKVACRVGVLLYLQLQERNDDAMTSATLQRSTTKGPLETNHGYRETHVIRLLC